MKVNVNQNRIIIILETDEEKDAINAFVAKNGEIGIEQQLQAWMASRVATFVEEDKGEVWTRLTRAERQELRGKVRDRKKDNT